jgi:hypothetical protein
MKLFETMLFFVLSAGLVGSFVTNAVAQTVVSGELDGTVMDPSGAVIPNATVKLSNPDTAFEAIITTGDGGTFRFALLKPGKYTIAVSASGFKSVRIPVAVDLGQANTVPVKLEIGNVAETIEITTEVPLLQTENGNLSTAVDARSIDVMPSPGMDITNYALTTPGVSVSTGAGYGNFTANGMPGTSNLYTVNGNDYNDPYLNLNNSGASNLLLGANELQEISIVTNGYTGEYGRMAGANVNYTTKGGTNKFHGNAGWNYNDTIFNANNWFSNNTGAPRPHAVSNQYYGSIGGPIVKNKLFFFFDTEGLRYVLPGGGLTWVPTKEFEDAVLYNLANNPKVAAVGPGSVPYYTKVFNLYNGATGAGAAVNDPGSIASPMCGSLAGLPVYGQSGVVFSDGSGTAGQLDCAKKYFSNVNNLNTESLYSVTVDYNATSKDVLRFRYKHDWGIQATGTDPVNPAFNANSNQPEWDGQAEWTHTFNANITNQFIFSGLYYSAIFGPSDLSKALGTFPTTIAFVDTSIANMGGTDNVYPQGRNVTQWQVVDDFSWTKGNHGIKFGVNYRKNDITSFAAGPNTSGSTDVYMQDFYNGATTNANGSTMGQAFAVSPHVPISYYSLGLYIQDEWRVKSNLKLTLSLRADRNSPEVCGTNCFSRMAAPFQSLNHDANIPYNQAIVTGLHQAFPNMQSVAWGPRVGFAWTPDSKFWKAGTTVIRGGGGLFTDLYPGFLADRFITNLPNVTSFTVGGDGIPISLDLAGNGYQLAAQSNSALQAGFKNGATLAQLEAQVPGFAIPAFNSIESKVVNPQYAEWNLMFEHAITNSMAWSVNYVGSHGMNLFNNNPGLNAYCANCGQPGYVSKFGDLPNAAPDTRFGFISEIHNSGISNYNGLTTSLTQKFSHGLQYTFNYTYSHSADSLSNGGLLPYSGNNASDSLRVQIDPYHFDHNYGPSDYDFRHFISANYYYQLPFTSTNHFVKQVIGGWALAQTFFYRTGEPFSVYRTSLASVVMGNAVSPAGTANRILMDYLGGSTVCSGPGADVNQPCLSATFRPYKQQSDFGNTGRNFFRGPNYFGSDLTLFKDFNITESGMMFRFTANFYNVFNHQNFANPSGSFTSGTFRTLAAMVTEPNSPYGNFQASVVSGRTMVLGLKFQF